MLKKMLQNDTVVQETFRDYDTQLEPVRSIPTQMLPVINSLRISLNIYLILITGDVWQN